MAEGIHTYVTNFCKSKVSKNIFFLGITQVINFVFPLLTLPFLVKTLGDSGYGKVAFAQTFIGYFLLIVDYGFNISATRKVAIQKNNPSELRKTFYNVIYSKIALLAISAVCLIAITILFERFRKDAIIYWLFFGMVVGNLFYPQWLFQGIEKMSYITIVNLIIKTIFTGLVFLIIRKESDYFLVGALTGISYIVPGIWAFIKAKKIVGKAIPLDFSGIKTELSDGFPLFISTTMSSVLLTSAVFVLGLMETDNIVGGYAAIEKLIKATLMLFTPITTAIYPTISQTLAISEKEGIRSIIRYAIPTIFLSLCLMIILFLVKKPLISVFYTEQFLQFSSVYVVLSIWIPVGVLNNFIGIQYLTGSNRGKTYGQAFSISGVMAIVLMIVLTKFYSYTGTALAVLFGELILTAIMFIMIFFNKKR